MFPCAGGGGSIVCSSDCCLTFSAIAAPDMTSSATLIRSQAIGKRWREVGRAKVCSRFRTQTVSSLEGGSIGCLVERDWMMLLVLEVLASAQSVVGIGRGCQWGVSEDEFMFSKRLAVGHIASHAAIFRAQSSERTISGFGGCTKTILGALEWSRRVDMRPTL